MSTPQAWFDAAAEALHRQYKHHGGQCDCAEKVPMWTAEDEVHLDERVRFIWEQELAAKDAIAEAKFLKPIKPADLVRQALEAVEAHKR